MSSTAKSVGMDVANFDLTSTPTTKPIGKITPKTIVGKIKPPDKLTALYLLLGVVSGYREVATDSGPSIMFQGSFRAQRASDGVAFTSQQMVAPHSATSKIIKALEDAGENAAIEFAYEISAKPVSTPLQYEHTTKELIVARKADLLQSLTDETFKILNKA